MKAASNLDIAMMRVLRIAVPLVLFLIPLVIFFPPEGLYLSVPGKLVFATFVTPARQWRFYCAPIFQISPSVLNRYQRTPESQWFPLAVEVASSLA